MVTNTLDLLLPSFRAKVVAMLIELVSTGHYPVVHETLRTPARQAELVRRGTSKSNRSLHLIGAALDIICKHHQWDCHRYGCDFYEALGAAAKSVGLYWGGDMFPKNPFTGRRFVDKPHVQAVPYRRQSAFRRAVDRETFLRRLYDKP